MRPERVEEIYESLTELTVELDSNPAALGPIYMQGLISTTRGFLNKVAYYMQEVLREKHGLEDELAAYEAAFEIESDGLMASDSRVTRLPAVNDRKAMINVILSEKRKKILELGVAIGNLAAIEKVVKHRQRELDRTMSEIRLQRSLIATEAKTGSFYGSESEGTTGTFGNQPPKDDIGEEEIENLMREADAALEDDPEDSDEPEAEPAAEEKPTRSGLTDIDELLVGLEDDESPEDAEPAETAAPDTCEECGGHGGHSPKCSAYEEFVAEGKALTEESLGLKEKEPEAAEPEAAEPEAEDPDVDPDIARFLDGDEDLGDIFEQL